MTEREDHRHDDERSAEQVGPELVEMPSDEKPVEGDDLRAWLDEALKTLPASLGRHRSRLLRKGLEGMIDIAASRSNLLETKMVTQAMVELAEAFGVFAPYRNHRKVAIFGSARTGPGSAPYETAKELARTLVDDGYMIITGAGPGVMQAGNEGAGREHSFGLNIDLPFEQSANPFIDGDEKLVNFRYFFTRKLVFVKEASAIVACPGGFGTQDELFESLTLLQTGRGEVVPIVLYQPPGDVYWEHWLLYVKSELLREGLIGEADLELFEIASSAEEARAIITGFYRRYHSSRYVRNDLLIRMKSELPAGGIERLNDEFGEILRPDGGAIRTSDAVLPHEQDVPELHHLPRLLVPFDRHNYGQLKKMIGVINEL